MKLTPRAWAALVALIAVVAGSYLYLSRSGPEPSRPAPPAPRETLGAPEVRHPIESVQLPGPEAGEASAPTVLPSLDQSDDAIEAVLFDLLGREVVLDMLNAGGYVRRFVATVDNLPRERAPSRSWPVKPTPGRFVVEPVDERTYLSTANFERYLPFVDLATAVDRDRIVALYVRNYALFQQAYEDLGYPGQYFNDRLVDVIDHLLATPEPGDDVEVVLPTLDPSIEVTRPWVLYEFADPRLESLSAGQKILIRVGSANAGRLKETLRAVRERLASGPLAAPAGR